MESTKVSRKNSADLSDLQKQIVASVKVGKSLLGKDGALTPLLSKP